MTPVFGLEIGYVRSFQLALVLATMLGCPPVAVAPRASPTKLYVAVDGSDRGSGSLEAPFATLARARDAARALHAKEIVVRGGTYFLAEPLVLAPEDSGLVISSYPHERAVLSGGVRITGWTQTEVNGQRAWTANVPGLWFRELFVSHERRPRTRLPKEGYFHVAEVPDMKPDAPWLEGQRRFRFAPGELKAWANLTDVEVVALPFWVESRMPIATIDEKERLATFARRSVFRLTEKDGPSTLARYYVENVFEALDTPGQWYLNRATGLLTYLPRPGEELANVEVIAPRLEQLVRFEGHPETGRFVDHVELRGLAFRDAEWSLGDRIATPFALPDVAGALQAAVNVPGAIWMNGTRDSTIEDCSIAEVGGYGIELAAGCQRDRIVGCDIGDLGGGGIKIGEETIRAEEPMQTGHITVTDSHIHDGGFVYRSAVGVWVGQSAGNVIAHNHVHDFDYTGISVGWSWGYKPSSAKENLVEKNHVHDIGRGVLSDLGGVYTLGPSPGTVIRGNVFHDITSYDYGGWGIYFDEGTSGVVAEKNAVYRTKSGGFFQNYGKDNLVANNVFALSHEGELVRGREEGSISFERNIIYFREGELLSWHWSNGDFRFDRNLYWDTRGAPMTFAGASLEEWRKRGMDAHSLVADPMFVDPERGDFTLRAGSPARELGFEPLDLRDVGPRHERGETMAAHVEVAGMKR